MKSQFLFILFFAITIKLAAQDTRDEVKPIAHLLQNELVKAGLPLIEINTKGKINNPGFQLSLLSAELASDLHLNDQPNDAFYIKATLQSVFIGSKSIAGLRNGVYGYLRHLGFRFYFPSEVWHVIPRLSTPYKPLEETGIPSFHHRNIWYAYGTGSEKANADYKKWIEANLLGGEEVNAGHSYDGIVNRNKKMFQEHPEYFAQKIPKGSLPKIPKFEVGDEGLVQLLIKDAFQQIENTVRKTGQPPAMISMDPSDGGGFSTSHSSLKIGGPSEQAFYLANRVAKAIRQKYPAIKVGMYAYNFHAAPPSFSIEPNIIVMIATAMNQSAFRTDELIEAWRKKGVTVGIRDYFGVMAWDWDMPGQVKGSKLSYVKKLKDFHENDIRLFTAETNIGWISRGLGHYAAARLLWDANNNPESIKKEFLQQMFGNAAGIMEQLYDSWEAYNQPIPLDGDLLKWHQIVAEADKTENDKGIKQRLDQVKQYLFYVYLFKEWKKSNSDNDLVALLNFAYRIQDDGIVASYPLFRRLANSSVSGKEAMSFKDKNALWKRNSSPVDKQEINANFGKLAHMLNAKSKTVQTILPNTFRLLPHQHKELINITSAPVRLRGLHMVLFHTENPMTSFINLSAGLIKAENFKTLRLKIYPYNPGLITSNNEPVMESAIQPKQPLKAISLRSLKPGSYFAVIDDAKAGFNMSFTGPVAFGIMADSRYPTLTFGRNNLFFTVQKGTKEFIIQTEGALTLKSPAGRIIDLQKKNPQPLIIPVRNNEEGAWQMQKQINKIYLQGASPLLCPDERFLLSFPKE
jgi:hypothetical protein